MGKKYDNPPLIEVLCEFHLNSQFPWDIVYPGLIYNKLKKDFPNREQVQIQTLDVSADPRDSRQIIRIMDRIQFLNNDRNGVVQVGKDFLSINHLTPYPSWNKFLPLIEKALKCYCEEINPDKIIQINLRYINKFDLKAEGKMRIRDYFNFRPFLGEGMPQTFGFFNVGIHAPYENERDILKIELYSLPSPIEIWPVILDLDYCISKPDEITLQTKSIQKWLTCAHDNIENVFEATITDTLRKNFKEVL